MPPVAYALDMQAPAGGVSPSIPWVEVRGRAGRAALFEADIALVMDVSLSTHRSSGIDLDEDGVIGEMRGAVMTRGSRSIHPTGWTTDSDDTIAKAELEAARVVIRGLGPRRNRIGLLTYTDRARVRVDVGPPDAALASLDEVRISDSTTGTSIASALRVARELLLEQPPGESPRQRAVVLFTDGKPTVPQDEYLGSLRAIDEASHYPLQDVDLYVFAFGPIAEDQARFLLELAGTAEGRLYKVGDPRRLLEDLDPVDLAPRWLEIENATSGEPAQGVRSSRDGRFDAFVPLLPGDNQIRVLAELGDGRIQRWEQTVRYDPPQVETAAQHRETERVMQVLRERSDPPESDAAAGPP